MSARLSRAAALQLRADQRQREVEEKLKLIAQVQDHPLIWDRRLKEHNDVNLVDKAWRDIAAAMSWDKMLCKKNWKNILDYFRNLYYEYGLEPRSGDAEDIKWPFFKSMFFVKDLLNRRESSSPLITASSSSSSTQKTHQTISKTTVVNNHQERESDTDSNSKSSRSQTPPQIQLSFSETLPQSQITQRGIKRTHSEDLQNAQLVAEQPFALSTDLLRPDDANVRFANYLVDVLRDVPKQLQRSCHQTILQVANHYADGVHPVIVIPE